MKKTILILFLFLMIVPILSLIAMSFERTNGIFFRWYVGIVRNEAFTSSLVLSLFVAVSSAFISTILSFAISLAFFNKTQRIIVTFLIVILGLLPSDILSLGINRLSLLLGLYNSNTILLFFGLILYCLPFCVLLFWIRYYFIDKSILIVAKDLGLNRLSIVIKILIPLTSLVLLSSLLFSFLLSFNEYTRSSYLSGSDVLLSEFLYGKLNSGTDPSIYAGGSLVIFITIIFVSLLILFFRLQGKKRKGSGAI